MCRVGRTTPNVLFFHHILFLRNFSTLTESRIPLLKRDDCWILHGVSSKGFLQQYVGCYTLFLEDFSHFNRKQNTTHIGVFVVSSTRSGFVVVDLLFIVTPIFWSHLSIVLCFVVRYFMSLLVLQSSWWGRESWLLCIVCLPGVSWLVCGLSSRCHGFVCSLWLWYFLIILAYYLWCMRIVGLIHTLN